MTKAEQEAKDRHEAFEKNALKTHGMVILPRSGEPGAPDHPDFPKIPSAPPKKKGS